MLLYLAFPDLLPALPLAVGWRTGEGQEEEEEEGALHRLPNDDRVISRALDYECAARGGC